MKVQKLKNHQAQEEIKDCYDLWSMSFGDSKEYMDYYFENKVTDNEIYVLKEEEQVESMLHLNPFAMSLNGEENTFHYIVGVATEKEKRGRGYMRKVLTEALQRKYAEGEMFTYLMPAAKEIYLPYDFRYMYSQDRVKGLLKKKELFDGTVTIRTFDQLSEQEKEEVVDFVNAKLATNFSLYTVRSKAYYERTALEMQAAGGNVVCMYEAKKLIAVSFYMLENSHMEIVETVTEKELTKKVANALLNSVTEQFEEELHVAWLETYFLDKGEILSFLNEPECYEQPIIMARILDVKQALTKLTLRGDKEVRVRIAVVDPIIAQNEQTYQLTVTKEKTTVEETDQPADITIDIATFTEVFFGSKMVPEFERLKGCESVYINEIV